MRLRCTVALVGTFSIGSLAVLAPVASATTTTTTTAATTTTTAKGGLSKAAVAARTAVIKDLNASAAASSVTVNGSASQGKEVITLSVQASDDAQGVGSIGISGAVVHAIRLGKNVYFNANTKFWKDNGGTAAAALFVGKWVETAATTNDGQPLADFLDVTTLFEELFSGNITTAVFSPGKKTTLGGMPVIAYSGKDATGGTGGTIYVNRTGKHYVVELTSLGGQKGHSLVVFSGYNQPVHAVAPKGAIDIDSLKPSTSG
jgi:hypothetical protein